MKLKRLSSLVGLLAALLVLTGGRVQAANAIAVANAYAFTGGSDTVDVLVTTNAAYPGAEITLSYDKTALSTAEANVISNDAAWNPSWGAPSVVVDTAAGTITVGFVSLTDVTAKIPQSSSALKLFSVIFEVDSTATVGSYAITPSGNFVSVDANYNTVEVPVTSLTAGSLIVQSLYNMSVDSVSSGPGVMTPVGINLSNGRDIVSIEFTIAYDSSQVVYGDSIEINDLYTGGSAEAPQVIDYGDSLTVAIYTLSAAVIPVSNTERWIARVYMVSADSAMETASNPLWLTTNTSVQTRDANYNLIDNSPNLVAGNFEIQSKYALRVGDAEAPQGGSDTVNVYLRSSETIVGVEAEIFFDSTNFTVSQSDVMVNEALFASGSPTVSITSTDSSVKVLALAQATDSIAASASERMLFSVILGVKDSAAAGYDSLDAAATVTTRDANYNTEEVTVSSITKGAFKVLAPYEITVKSRSAVPEAQNVPVSILLTNQADIYSAEVVVKYDTTALKYVEGSVMVNQDIWSGTAPDPQITVGGDSIKIGLIDLNDVSNMIAGGSANRTLLTIGFNIDSSLVVDVDTTWLTPSGLLAGRDNNYNPLEYTPVGTMGYIAIASDIVPPGPVSSAMATVTGSTVSLSWKNPTDTDLDYVMVRRSMGGDTVAVVTRDTPIPGANDSYDDLNVPQGTYNYDFLVADLNGNMGNVVTVEVTVGEGTVPSGNTVSVGNRVARPGGVAKPWIKLSNTMDDIAGVSLKVTFDNTMLMLTDVTPGSDAAGLAPVSAVDIDSANASGEIMLDMIDLSGSQPVMAGATVKKLAMLEFMVDSSATIGDTVALTLSDVSLSDPTGNDLTATMTSGMVAIQAKASTDLNGDGMTNIGDIWYYINMDEMVQFESLAELIADLLAQPLPTSLAAVQDATATNYRVDGGAALIDLKTDYEIVAVRFTFSYDTKYQLEGVGLNPALADRMMIKQVVSGGRLYVDVIALGGFVPAEVGDIFSVAFRDTDHQTAGLTLEKIETGDRDGNVRIEAAKVNRIALPKAYSLSQNSPNPFNPSTTVKYQVPEGDAARVQIVVYNIRGQKVVTLVDELKESGEYSVNWNGLNASGQRVSSGVYFYRMSAGEFSAMRKMVIVK